MLLIDVNRILETNHAQVFPNWNRTIGNIPRSVTVLRSLKKAHGSHIKLLKILEALTHPNIWKGQSTKNVLEKCINQNSSLSQCTDQIIRLYQSNCLTEENLSQIANSSNPPALANIWVLLAKHKLEVTDVIKESLNSFGRDFNALEQCMHFLQEKNILRNSTFEQALKLTSEELQEYILPKSVEKIQKILSQLCEKIPLVSLVKESKAEDTVISKKSEIDSQATSDLIEALKTNSTLCALQIQCENLPKFDEKTIQAMIESLDENIDSHLVVWLYRDMQGNTLDCITEYYLPALEVRLPTQSAIDRIQKIAYIGSSCYHQPVWEPKELEAKRVGSVLRNSFRASPIDGNESDKESRSSYYDDNNFTCSRSPSLSPHYSNNSSVLYPSPFRSKVDEFEPKEVVNNLMSNCPH